MKRSLIVCAVVLGLCLSAAPAHADFGLVGTIGGNGFAGGNSFPFGGNSGGASTRYQQAYNGALFPNNPILISAITFYHVNTASPGNTIIANGTYAMHMSTTSHAVNGLDTVTFNNNVGGDDQLFDNFVANNVVVPNGGS